MVLCILTVFASVSGCAEGTETHVAVCRVGHTCPSVLTLHVGTHVAAAFTCQSNSLNSTPTKIWLKCQRRGKCEHGICKVSQHEIGIPVLKVVFEWVKCVEGKFCFV